MKKIFIVITVFIITLFALLYFSSTEYFFNKFIAPNIKSYHFSYKRVSGSLLSGFTVDKLSYKNKQLASYVELRFNPFKLLEKRVSVSKLVLKDVDKKSLKVLINDFKKDTIESNNSSKSSPIALNFELKNIYLTFKPFKFKNLEVNKNILKIKEISYINGKLNLAKNHYFYDSNFGKLEFDGEFKKGILNISKIYLKNFDIDKTLKFLSYFESNSSKSDTKEGSNVLFMPKEVNIDKLYASLKPFKYKSLDITQAELGGEDIKLNLGSKKLLEAYLNLKLKSTISDFDTKIILKDKKLIVPELEVALLNTNDLVKFIDTVSVNKNESNNSGTIDILSFIPLEKIVFDKSNFLLKNFSLKKERVKKLRADFDKISFDLNKSKLSVNNCNLLFNSTLANLSLNGKIDKEIILDKLIAKSDDVNKIIKFISSFKSNDSNSSSSFNIFAYIPKELNLKEAKVDIKKLYFEPYKINKGSLTLKNTLFDLNKTILKSGYLSVSNDSNWGKAFLKGNIKDNIFYAKGEVKVNENLIKKFNLPLNAKNIEPIKLNGKFGLEYLDLNASLKGKDILTLFKNLDILNSNNRVYYNYSSNKTIWSIVADVKSDYVALAKVKNKLSYFNNKLTYQGSIIAKKDLNIDKNINSLLSSLMVTFKGDSNNIDLKFNSKYLEGKLFAKEYKKGELLIKNKRVIDLYEYTKIKDAKLNKIIIKAPVNFSKFLPLKGDFLIDSNLLNSKGEFNYNKYLTLKATLKDSKILPKEINKKALFPAKLDLTFKDNLELNIKDKILSANLKYMINSDLLNFQIKNSAFSIDGKGNSKSIKSDIKISSIKRALKEIKRVYKIGKIPDIEGKVDINLNSDFKNLKFAVASNKIIINNKKSKTEIKNLKVNGKYSNSEIVIDSYRVNIKDFNFFANRSSLIKLNKDSVNIKQFYINDTALISGIYNIKQNRGKIKIKAKGFKFSNIDYDLNTNLDVNIDIIKNRYSISGIVNIIKATIKKNLENRNAVDSEDIIILQREAQKKSTFYFKNIKLNLKIKSKNGILYAQNGSYFIAYPKLKIIKSFNNFIKMSGVITLDKKSHYRFKGKTLYVKRGKITFKGNSSIAYLNILMHYKGREYDIYINITGTSTRPIVFFSSNPPLTKEQILAYLLFNDTGAAGTHSQESMMNLVGSVLAQSFFGSIGIKIDKLNIRENGFSIGKAINKRVIIYYNQEGETPSVKTRIDITKSVHSVIEVGENKQSADIIFSKEY